MKHHRIDLSAVTDWKDFHDLFAKTFSFPDYYGHNMNAWIDCMEEHVIGDEFLLLELSGMATLKQTRPDISEAIKQCAAFINSRSTEGGGDAVIALSYS